MRHVFTVSGKASAAFEIEVMNEANTPLVLKFVQRRGLYVINGPSITCINGLASGIFKRKCFHMKNRVVHRWRFSL